MKNKFRLETKDIWNMVILISIGLIIVSGFMVLEEFIGARKDCRNINGEFNYKFPSQYFCNNKSFLRYNDGWDFSREINFSNIIFP